MQRKYWLIAFGIMGCVVLGAAIFRNYNKHNGAPSTKSNEYLTNGISEIQYVELDGKVATRQRELISGLTDALGRAEQLISIHTGPIEHADIPSVLTSPMKPGLSSRVG